MTFHRFSARGIDEVALTVTNKRTGEIVSNARITPTENERVVVALGNEFDAVAGETYIVSFVGYLNGVSVSKDECCVVGGYIANNNEIHA